MLDVFLCHAEPDAAVAREIAGRLERTAEARVWLEEARGGCVAELWEGGTSSAAILLLLSPHSTPRRLARAEWEGVLAHVEHNADPPLGCVLLADCPYPRLLERKNFFRWSDGPLRAVQRWVMSLHAEQQHFTPAAQPWFSGRAAELRALFDALVDDCGTVVLEGFGKTALAQEFALRASDYFRDVLWVECAGRTRTAILGALALQLGTTLDSAGEGLAALMEPHRLLLVLDGLEAEIELPRGSASVLVAGGKTAARLPAVTIHLPAIAVPLEAPADPTELRLWQAMAFCGPGAFSIDLACRMARVAPSTAERLFERRLADRFDATRARVSAACRAAARATAGAESGPRRHAQAVHQAVSAWRSHPARASASLSEVPAALEWAIAEDWPLAVELGLRAFTFLRSGRHMTQGAELLDRLREAAAERGDARVLANCNWDLSWIRDSPIEPVEGGGAQLALPFAATDPG